MKKEQFKQLINECLNETDAGAPVLDNNVDNLKKQLAYFDNVIGYLEDKEDLKGAGDAKKQYWAIQAKLKSLGHVVDENRFASQNSEIKDPIQTGDIDQIHQDQRDSQQPINIDVNKLQDIEVDGIDRSDYPDFCDAYISAASYEGRPLTDDELDWLNNEHPEIVNDKAHDSLHESVDNYKAYFEE